MAINFTPTGTQVKPTGGIQFTPKAPVQEKKGFLQKASDFLGFTPLAKGIGATIFQRTKEAKGMETTQQNLQQTLNELDQRIREKKARGEDTSRLEATRPGLLQSQKQLAATQLNLGTGGGLKNREVIGSAINVAATLPAGAETLGLLKSGATKALPWMSVVKRGAAEGAAFGALGGFGRGVMDPEADTGDVVKSTLTGGATGAVLGGVLGGVAGKVIPDTVQTAKVFGKEPLPAFEKEIQQNLVDNIFTTTKTNKKLYNTVSKKGFKPEEEFVKRGLQQEVVDGKASYTKAKETLSTEFDTLNETLDRGLQRYADLRVESPAIINKIETLIKQDENLRNLGVQKKVQEDAIKILQGYMDDANRGYFNIPEIQNFKKAQYKQAGAYRKGPVPDYAKSDAATIVSRAFKELIEENVDDMMVKELNGEIGKIMQLNDFLTRIEGTAVKGGRLGQYVGQVVGAGLGAPSGTLGAILGAVGGRQFSLFLQKNAVVGPLKRYYLSQIQKGYGNQVLNDAIKYLDKIDAGLIDEVPNAVKKQIIQDLNRQGLNATPQTENLLPEGNLNAKPTGKPTIPLPARSQSTIDAQEMQRLQKSPNMNEQTNMPMTKENTNSMNTIVPSNNTGVQTKLLSGIDTKSIELNVKPLSKTTLEISWIKAPKQGAQVMKQLEANAKKQGFKTIQGSIKRDESASALRSVWKKLGYQIYDDPNMNTIIINKNL